MSTVQHHANATPESHAYAVEPLARAHGAAAIHALTAAFMTDPLFSYVAPADADRARWLPHLMAELVRLATGNGKSFVALARDGRVAGCLCAGPYPPGRVHGVLVAMRLLLLPAPWRPGLGWIKRMDPYSKAWEQMHFKGKHYFVYIIGIHPDHQGRGAGSLLMRRFQRECDAGGVPIYLETQTASNVSFYQALGFHVTEEHHPAAEGPRTWGMFREPKS